MERHRRGDANGAGSHDRPRLFGGSLALALAGAAVLWVLLSRGATAQQQEVSAEVRDQRGRVVGAVTLVQRGAHVRVEGRFAGLPPGFHGFHIHAIGQCAGDFTAAGGHLNPAGASHPSHRGDMPVLLVNADGSGEARFETDRFSLDELFDADGSAVIVHANPDNYANIPTRYAPQPDAPTLATGDAGGRIGCGVVQTGPARAVDGQTPAGQPGPVVSAFRAVWGDAAEEEWVLEHDRELGATP